jgi:hypothetical protein
LDHPTLTLSVVGNWHAILLSLNLIWAATTQESIKDINKQQIKTCLRQQTCQDLAIFIWREPYTKENFACHSFNFGGLLL